MTWAQYIGGDWVPASGGGTWDLVDPATEKVVDSVPFGDGADVSSAVDAAGSAFADWSRTDAFSRGSILDRAADLLVERADEYAVVTTEESGKPLAQARAEWLSAPNYLRFAASAAMTLGGREVPSRVEGRRIDVTHMPLGVIGVITAWNFPVYNVNRAVSSALAAGCTVVLRPSEYTPRSAWLYARALADAGLPPGVLNVVNGDPHVMGQAMLDDPRVRKIGFTGSTRVGRLLMEGASRTVTRLSLEMGGNAPAVVFPDVDVESVAASAVVAKYRNCGQTCITPQRFLLHRDIAAEFTEALVEGSREQKVGSGLDPSVTVGPLINAAQRDRVERLVADTVARGAGLATGGERVDGPGYFYTPTVLTQVEPRAPVFEEEVFGPVLPILTFDTVDEAIGIANASEYGLAAYVWTRDLNVALRVSDELEYGLVGVNDWYPVVPEAPFGGMKQSGMGRESGLEGLAEYLDVKTRFIGGLG